MKQAIKTIESTTLAMPMVLPEDKYQLAKDTVAKGATDAEFQLLLHIAQKYQLDPLAKQIWCIKRKPEDPAIIMASRDGYLEIAHRSGQFDGMESGTIDDEKGNPIKAWCVVYRKDMNHPFKAEAKYKEYAQYHFDKYTKQKKLNSTWEQYPSAMLIKVAEVFALKRAFSISGMVTEDELEVEDKPTKPIKETKEVKFVSEVASQVEEPKSFAEELMQEDEEKEGLLLSLDEWLQKASEVEGKSVSVLVEALTAKYGEIEQLGNESLSNIIANLEKKYG